MLPGAVLDRAHRLAGPLVVHVDVRAHARVGLVLLLVRIEAVIVVLVLARHVIRQFVKLQALAAQVDATPPEVLKRFREAAGGK